MEYTIHPPKIRAVYTVVLGTTSLDDRLACLEAEADGAGARDDKSLGGRGIHFPGQEADDAKQHLSDAVPDSP